VLELSLSCTFSCVRFYISVYFFVSTKFCYLGKIIIFVYCFAVKEEEMKKAIKELEDDKNSLQRKLRLTQQMLDEQIEKIKNHVGFIRYI
jgi:hypothetical protein